MGNSGTTPRESRANDRVSASSDESSDYADWHPGQKIAEAARQAAEAEGRHKPIKRPDLSRGSGSRSMVPPAPHVPRYDPSAEPPKPPTVSEAQQALNRDASQARCPAQGGRFTHMIPAVSTACVRCGTEASTILDQLEVTP